MLISDRVDRLGIAHACFENKASIILYNCSVDCKYAEVDIHLKW